MNQHEAKIQKSFIAEVNKWFQMCKKDLVLDINKKPKAPFFAIRNEGKATQGQRFQRAKMGLIGGVPDTFLPIPSSGFHGLFIEFKLDNTPFYKATKQSANQKEWDDFLTSQGFKVAVCTSVQGAMDVFINYMEGVK